MREITCRNASVLLVFLVAVAATASGTEQVVASEVDQQSPTPVQTVAQNEGQYSTTGNEFEVEFRDTNSSSLNPLKVIPDYNYRPNEAPAGSRTLQKRSISNIIKLLLGGNVPPNHPLVKSPEIEQKTWSLASNIASSLIGGGSGHGHGGWGPSAADQIQHILHTKAKIIPYTGQVASGLTGIAAVKGDILKQIHSLSTAVIAQAAAEAAAKAVASAAAAHAVTAGVAQGIHQTKYAVNKAVKHAKANIAHPSAGGWNRPSFGGGGWNDYQQAFYSTYQNSYAPAPSGKAPGDLPGPPYGRDSNAAIVSAPQASQYHSTSLGGGLGALGGLLNAASQTFSQAQSAPQQQQSSPQAYDLYSSFNNGNNNGNPEARSEQYNTLPSYQQGDQQQTQWGGLFGPQQPQQKPGSSFLNMFQGGFPSGSTKVQDTQNMSVPLTPERLSGLRNFPLFLSAASASVAGRNAPESPPSILTSLATLLSASASAYQAINKLSSPPGSFGVPNDPTAREDTAIPPTATAGATSPSFQGFSSSSAFQQSGQNPTAAAAVPAASSVPGGFPQRVTPTRYQPSGSSSQSQAQGNNALSTSGSSAVPTFAMAPQFNPSNFNSQASPSSFNSPGSSLSSRPQSSSAYQYNAQAPRDSHYAESVSRAQNSGGFNSGFLQQGRSTNNGFRYSGYPSGTGQSTGHASGSSVVPTNYWGNRGNPATASARNFETVGGAGNNANSHSSTGNFASSSGAFGASAQQSKQVYGFGGQNSQNFAQNGAPQQRNYQTPIQNYGNRPNYPSQGYSGHTNQPLNSFINSRYDYIAQSASPNNNQFTRRYELSSQPTQSQQIHSHQQFNNGFNNNRMALMSSNKPGGGFTIPLNNDGPVSFTLTIPNNGRQATILQERKGDFVPVVSEKRSSSGEPIVPSSEEGGNAGEAPSSISLEKSHPFSKESNSWEETVAEKKSVHNTNKEKIDYIYSKEVAESYESPTSANRKQGEEESREIKMRNSHETITTFLPKRKTPRLSPDDLRSLLVDEEEPESRGRVTQNSAPESFNLYNEEFAKKVSNNKKPKKDWDALRREARAKSLSALVQRLMGTQE